MAKINNSLSPINYEVMREYCMANGKPHSHAKGDWYAEVRDYN